MSEYTRLFNTCLLLLMEDKDKMHETLNEKRST